ncbi:MAG: photosynthetic reaction center cytochrome c subunit family protein [Vicinamibacterales bacterium]
MVRLLTVAWLVGASCLTVNAQDEVQARMRLWSASLGVECVHCHVTGAWTDRSKPAHEFAQRMRRMVDALNAGPLKEVEAITCWTCHRGQPRPARLPRPLWEGIQSAHAAEFASKPDSALAMSVYSASLGVECSHCHEPGNWRAAGKPAYAMVEKMMPIFDEIPKHFDKSRMPTTQCYLCHQGQRIPERRPR